jgi:hypothetical protein
MCQILQEESRIFDQGSDAGSPNEKHWHGAAPTPTMTHVAIQERLDGKAVGWMEQVSDEPYPGLS